VLRALGKLGCTDTSAIARASDLFLAAGNNHALKDGAAAFMFTALESILADGNAVSASLPFSQVNKNQFKKKLSHKFL
jgi:hypothetical protein